MSTTARQFFNENGYVILTGFCTPTETGDLREAAGKIVSDFVENAPPVVSVFSTNGQVEKTDGRYFLDSVTKASCFLEEKQKKDSGVPAINKIGHALCEVDPVFKAFTMQRKVADVATAMRIEQAVVAQSMYILKNARVGGEVRPHRDATFVRSRRQQLKETGLCLGYWWALENATVGNGCLWVVPGSHCDEYSLRFKLVETRDDTLFVGVDDNKYEMKDFLPLPMQCGDLILLHGDVLHMSKENTSEKSRHAYSIHVVEEAVSDSCWLCRADGPSLPRLD